MSRYEKGGDSKSDDRYKPMDKKELNKRKILENIAKPSFRGSFQKAVDGVCSYVTFMKYRRDDPEFEEQLLFLQKAAKEELGDKIEDRMLDALLDDDKPLNKNQVLLMMYYTKTKLKDRGYTERSEVKTDPNDTQIQIQYVVPEPPKQIDNIEDIDHVEIKKDEDE